MTQKKYDWKIGDKVAYADDPSTLVGTITEISFYGSPGGPVCSTHPYKIGGVVNTSEDLVEWDGIEAILKRLDRIEAILKTFTRGGC